MATAAATPPPAVQAGSEPLELADSVELIGEYEGSGYKDPPLLARRGDGQMIQLTRLLYCIAAASDGRRDAEAVAAQVTQDYGKKVSPDSVRHLVERKLRPLGVLALADGTTPELPKREPVMALRHRKPLIPERGVNFIARGFTWIHSPPVLLAFLSALAGLDVWLFGIHGIAGGMRAVLYNPTLLLGVMASIVVATAFHEIGHASACRYGGARPGVMGIGLYLVWPAFYCDVTDAYRLGRMGRLRTDLGGVYFNGIFALACGLAFFATGQEALLLIAFIQHTIVLQQLLPLLRFDGYYVLSDLTGVPDILSRVKPIFRSLVPGGGSNPKVDALKPWVRVVVTAYLLVLIPTLAFMIVSTVIAAPRMLATAYDSLGMQIDRIRDAAAAPEVALGAFKSGALVLPIGAIAVSLMRTGRMATRGLLAWSDGSVPRRMVAVAAMAAVTGAAGYTWWPNGDYQPIRPGERGTIGEALDSLPHVASGRAAFTPEREQQFGPVPTVREQAAARAHGGRPLEPRSPQETVPEGALPEAPGDAPGDVMPDDPTLQDPAAGDPGYGGSTATPAPAGTTPAPTATTSPAAPQPSATATPTPSATATPTPSATATPTSTPTTTTSPDATGSVSPSSTAVPTVTPSVSPVLQQTPTITATP